MTKLTTHQVEVSAQSFYQQQYSEPANAKFVYAYRICIKNQGKRAFQLLSRAWEVIDATGQRRHVEGEGVVGKQPVIEPGAVHEYSSWVQFETPIGAMQGSFVMARKDRRGREEYFQVEIPRFLHLAPELLN